jgi:hypothetical protein
LKTEFGFDLVQVAKNRYASQQYHEFIGSIESIHRSSNVCAMTQISISNAPSMMLCETRNRHVKINETHEGHLELDSAFRYAVTLAWGDLMKPIEPRSIRVEYLSEPGTALDHLSVWSVWAGGYQDLVCDFWAFASLAHPGGAGFGNVVASGLSTGKELPLGEIKTPNLESVRI